MFFYPSCILNFTFQIQDDFKHYMENIAYAAAKGNWRLPTSGMATGYCAGGSSQGGYGGGGVPVSNTTQPTPGGNYPSTTNIFNADSSGGYYQQLLNAPLQ